MREFLAQPGRPARRAVRSPWWSLSWALVPIAAAAMLILLLPKVTIPRRKTLQSVEARLPAMPALDKPSPGIPSQPAAQEPAQASLTTAETPVNPPPQPLETAGNVLPVPATATPEPDTHPESEAEPGPSPAHSMAPGFAPVVATAAGQPSRPEPAAPPPAPAFVRINAGTRVWILLQSTSPAANGGFAFKGMVLLPVTEGGTVLLDRETRVVGTGKVDQGRTTIRIAEFVWQGTRYRLRRAPQAPASRSPGSGPAVEFNAGQVLETWMAVPSIYEKVQGNAPKG